MHDTRTITSAPSIVSTDGPRNDIPTATAEVDPHAEFRAAFIESIPHMLKGVPNAQQDHAREVLESTFERSLLERGNSPAGQISGMLRSLETYLRATVREHVSPQKIALQGLDLGVLESFAGGVGVVSLPLRGQIRIQSASRVIAEYSSDSLVFRSADLRLAPRPGQLIVFRKDPSDEGAAIPQWSTATDHIKPALPCLASPEEFGNEARYLFPNMVFQSSADTTRGLPLNSAVLQSDLGRVISAALDKVAVTPEKAHALDALRVDFGTGIRHLQRVLSAKDGFMHQAAERARLEATLTGIGNHEFVQALCRAVGNTIPAYGVFNSNEVRELTGAFDHLNRAGHLLLHVMGINSSTMDTLT